MEFEYSQDMEFKAGTYILRQGEVSDDVYVVQSGKVEVLNTDSEGVEHITGSLEAGQVFGELEFIMEEPRTYSVRTVTDVVLLRIDPRVFAELYELEIGRLIRPILQSWSERLRTVLLRGPEGETEQCSAQPLARGEENKFRVTITPCTQRAKIAMQGMEKLEVEQFPLYVGRYSRRRSDEIFHANNLFLRDPMPYTLSRSHFSLTSGGDSVVFHDRGSTLGSIVNGTTIGGSLVAPKKVNLRPGKNSLVIGSDESGKLVFEIEVKAL